MNARDFLTELHLASASTDLPLPALVRAIDPGREELAQDLANGRSPHAVFEAHGLIPAATRSGNRPPLPFKHVLAQAAIGGQDNAYALRLVGAPLFLLIIAASALTLCTWFYLRLIRPVFADLLGEGAYGFEGMWQVRVSFWFLLLLTAACFLLGVMLCVKLLSKRSFSSWFLTRLLPSAERVDRLDRLGTEVQLSREERTRQLYYSAESNGGEWASFIPVFVLWVAPTVVMAIMLPLIKLVTSLQS